eukprot:6213115-Pleurochrysis_carterae.AAC.2
MRQLCYSRHIIPRLVSSQPGTTGKCAWSCTAEYGKEKITTSSSSAIKASVQYSDTSKVRPAKKNAQTNGIWR